MRASILLNQLLGVFEVLRKQDECKEDSCQAKQRFCPYSCTETASA